MKQCPRCGAMVPLGRMYCSQCGIRLDFVESEVASRAVEERRSEKLLSARQQLIEWIIFTIILTVAAWCFKDYFSRMPAADVPPFFLASPAIGTGQKHDPMTIGRPTQGREYLNLERKALPIPKIESIAPAEPADAEKTEDTASVKAMAGAGPVVVMMKDGKTTVLGKLLGKTQTHITLAEGDTIRVFALNQVDSVQEAPK